MDLIPSSGFTVTSLFRGMMGMLVLLLIAYLSSNDRKQIAWKTVGLGLLTQIIIAIGVLKISWVKGLFEGLGGFFISVLEYTGVQKCCWVNLEMLIGTALSLSFKPYL
jgi:CNT family concentrative nucleoside transporter